MSRENRAYKEGQWPLTMMPGQPLRHNLADYVGLELLQTQGGLPWTTLRFDMLVATCPTS